MPAQNLAPTVILAVAEGCWCGMHTAAHAQGRRVDLDPIIGYLGARDALLLRSCEPTAQDTSTCTNVLPCTIDVGNDHNSAEIASCSRLH